MQTPIIFIHYGDTPYLKYSLSIAQKMNPNKEVILLGDKKNKKYVKLGIKHISFIKYNNEKKVYDFVEHFQYIGGGNRQTEQDKRFELFCFKRWFYLYEFMKENNLDNCWYFDSDTLILDSLKPEEEKFKKYDRLEQSNGLSMKGIIKFKQLHDYIEVINELFLNEEFIKTQQEKFSKLQGKVFNDMRAYETYKQKTNVKRIMLNKHINKETFDECICQEHGMEMEYNNYLRRKIKKLYFKNNEIFEKDMKTNNLIKLKAINLSWVTTSFIQKVYYYKIHGNLPPFYISLLGKISQMPRFIKTKITKETK